MNSSENGKLICSVRTRPSLNIDSCNIINDNCSFSITVNTDRLDKNIQFCVYCIMNVFDINLV